MIIVITGATGSIGKSLSPLLSKHGFTLHVLTHNPNLSEKDFSYPCKVFFWSSDGLPDSKAFPKDSKFGVIHLAGESISQWPWTKNKKKKIYDSRILSTQKLVKTFEQFNNFPEWFVSASAVGIYGNQESPVTESWEFEDQNLFLQTVCRGWEKEVLTLKDFSRVTILRFGLVLCPNKKGFLKQQLKLFKLFVPLLLFSKKRYFSWIHIEDLCSAILHVVQNQSKGIYNVTSSESSNWHDFFNEIALLTHKKYLRMPTLFLMMKWPLGEMGRNIMANCLALPEKLQKENFKFQYADLHSALKNLIRK